MATITGKTFENKEALKSVGARWNSMTRAWDIEDQRVYKLEALNLPGIVIKLDRAKDAEALEKAIDEVVKVITAVSEKVIEGSTVVYGDETHLLNAFADKNPKLFGGFSSLGTLVDFVEALPGETYSSHNSRNSPWSGSSFYGTRNMAEAIDLARNGWAHGVEKAREAMEILNADHVTKRQRDHSVAGGVVSVGRMLSGEPKHMKTRTRQPSKKIVTLYVEMVMSAGIDQNKSIIRAAVIGAMADQLEHAGYSCEIIAVNSSQLYQMTVNLKRAGEMLNLNDIVFALGHPAMLRRFGFGFATCDEVMSRHWGSMGHTSKAFKGSTQPEANEFYIDRLDLSNQDRVTGTFANQVRAMFPLIAPKNFPIRLA